MKQAKPSQAILKTPVWKLHKILASSQAEDQLIGGLILRVCAIFPYLRCAFQSSTFMLILRMWILKNEWKGLTFKKKNYLISVKRVSFYFKIYE